MSSKKRRNVSFEHEEEAPHKTRSRNNTTSISPSSLLSISTDSNYNKPTAFIAVAPEGSCSIDIRVCSDIWKQTYNMNVVFVGTNKHQKCVMNDGTTHIIQPSLSFEDLVELYDDDDDDTSNNTQQQQVLLLPGGTVGVNFLIQSESFMNFLQYYYLMNRNNNLLVACGASAVQILTKIKNTNNNSLVDPLGPTCYNNDDNSIVLYKERRNIWTSPGNTRACVQQLAIKVGDELCGRRRRQQQVVHVQQSVAVGEECATTTPVDSASQTVSRASSQNNNKRPVALTKSSQVRDIHDFVVIPKKDDDENNESTNDPEAAAVAAAPSLQAHVESNQDSSDSSNDDKNDEQSDPSDSKPPHAPASPTLKPSELTTARFWKYVWRPLSKTHGWWLRTVGGRHHYMTPGSTFAIQTRGKRWFESKRGVLDYLQRKQDRSDVYRGLLEVLNRHEAISEPGDGELQSLVEALQEQEQLKSVECKESTSTITPGPRAVRRVTNEREGVVDVAENKLFSHIVWPRLRGLGWTAVKHHGSAVIRYRPSAEEAPLTNPASVLEFLWTSPRWCLRTKVLCLLDLYESCKSIQEEMGDEVGLADVESEAKRRMPALAEY